MRYILDTEYDGHNGPLLSLSLVSINRNKEIHIVCGKTASDPWVLENVIPKLFEHESTCQRVVDDPDKVGAILRSFFFVDDNPTIIADSMTDITHFAKAYSTDAMGEYTPNNKQRFIYIVENVDSYPTDMKGAVQHNSWWDCVVLLNHLLAHNHELLLPS